MYTVLKQHYNLYCMYGYELINRELIAINFLSKKLIAINYFRKKAALVLMEFMGTLSMVCMLCVPV